MQAQQRAHDETCAGRAREARTERSRETERGQREEKQKMAFLMHAFLSGRMVMSQPAPFSLPPSLRVSALPSQGRDGWRGRKGDRYMT